MEEKYMKSINLNGKWKASGKTYDNIDAEVPGCIHTDLLNAGLIEDPFFNEKRWKIFLGDIKATETRRANP